MKTASTRNSNAYTTSKAITDQLVKDLNWEYFLTGCLRVCTVYGERESKQIPIMMKMTREGKYRIQISNTAGSDYTSGENPTLAHVLAAKDLLAKAQNPSAGLLKVDGEAFFIHRRKISYSSRRGSYSVLRVSRSGRIASSRW
jgi:sterol-4alpha-carboxylate 3-dehydrogenase (decarboxylating)